MYQSLIYLPAVWTNMCWLRIERSPAT